MTTFKQFIENVESINDDDWYLVDTQSKNIIKNLGKDNSPDSVKSYIEDNHQTVLKGMKVKFQGYGFKKETNK